MLKVLVLQKFHGLSDDATEEQIFDRTSFKNFLGLRIGDLIPDAKTIWDFKQRLEADAREGSIIDASFTEAPRQRNSREQNKNLSNLVYNMDRYACLAR